MQYLPYAQYSSKYDQQVKQAATRQAIAQLQLSPGDQLKGYTYYRAMSWEEYRATGGYLNDRRTSGEGPNITENISYILKAKFFIKNPMKYRLIVEYNSSLSPQKLDLTPYQYNTLVTDADGNQLPGGPTFRNARAAGMWYKKIEGNKGEAYSFPGVSTQTFNSSLLSPPKVHTTLSPENAGK